LKQGIIIDWTYQYGSLVKAECRLVVLLYYTDSVKTPTIIEIKPTTVIAQPMVTENLIAL